MTEQEEIKQYKKFIWWFAGVVIILSIVGFVMRRSISVADKALIRYEEFQEIYNTCAKLNTDLCRMSEVSESDKMFEQFSKAQRLLSIQTQLNRWVEEYNAKSKMWNRSLWKSSALPYQLSVNQFNCY